jgi:UDP-N-acetylglucosamine 2-epimerase
LRSGQPHVRRDLESLADLKGDRRFNFVQGDICGGGTHAQQTAKIMVGFEELCTQSRPDCVLVVGDLNSTLACAIVAKKVAVPVAHVAAVFEAAIWRCRKRLTGS